MRLAVPCLTQVVEVEKDQTMLFAAAIIVLAGLVAAHHGWLDDTEREPVDTYTI